MSPTMNSRDVVISRWKHKVIIRSWSEIGVMPGNSPAQEKGEDTKQDRQVYFAPLDYFHQATAVVLLSCASFLLVLEKLCIWFRLYYD